jgi:hypothetical protein
MKWHLPTIPELCKYVIWISVFDALVFFYAGSQGAPVFMRLFRRPSRTLQASGPTRR